MHSGLSSPGAKASKATHADPGRLTDVIACPCYVCYVFTSVCSIQVIVFGTFRRWEGGRRLCPGSIDSAMSPRKVLHRCYGLPVLIRRHQQIKRRVELSGG